MLDFSQDKKAKGARATKTNAIVAAQQPEPMQPALVPQPAPQVTTVFSREDVEKQLPTQLFKELVHCGHCNYTSKVRINILNHMDSHKSGWATNKDIVNPVPQKEDNELMFNKMTNHAAYSAKEGEKRDSVLAKVEVSAIGGL